MELIGCIAILGLMNSCLCDFFSDLEKLDIDSQLREIDEMLEKLDDDNDDGFDNVFNTVDDLVSGDCIYKCKNGAKPVPRKGHVPVSNGCGSFGLKLDTSSLPQMTECCDVHDLCYDTCNKDRDKCDNDFKTCLDIMCEKLKRDITKNQYEGCKETAKLIYGGTTALGCSPYLSAQEKACQCIATDSKPSTKTSKPKNQQREEKRGETKNKSKFEPAKGDSKKDKHSPQTDKPETRTKDSNKNRKRRVNDEL